MGDELLFETANKNIRSWYREPDPNNKSGNKYDHINLDLLLIEEFGMKVSSYFKKYSVSIIGQGRHLEIYDNCILYSTIDDLDRGIPITNDIFILADIVREKYHIKPLYNIFTDAKIDGGI